MEVGLLPRQRRKRWELWTWLERNGSPQLTRRVCSELVVGFWFRLDERLRWGTIVVVVQTDSFH